MKEGNKRFLAGILMFCALVLIGISCTIQKNEKPPKGKSVTESVKIEKKTIPKLDDTVIAFWEFKDATNPGKDSSPAKNNLIVKRDTAIKNGVLSLSDGSFNKIIKNNDYTYTPSKDFKLGNDSFSVECWFKTSKIKYDKLVGTRVSIRPLYKDLKGWALGLSKGKGAILFIVNDNKKNTSFAEVKIVNSNWDEDVLNHIIGVRDRKSKKLKLYLNGVLVSAVEDKTGDISSEENLKIGIDQYAGFVTEGTIKDIKIQKRALSSKKIAEQYAKNAKMESYKKASIVLKDKVIVPVDLKIDNTDGLNDKLNLQPQPQKIDYTQTYIALKTPIYVQIPKQPTDQEYMAGKILISDFKSYLKLDIKKLEAGKTIDSGTIIKLSKSINKIHSEGYILKIKNSDKVANISLASTDHGIIYGALTLMQVIEQVSLIKNGELSIPTQMNIYDYPEVPRRIQVQSLSRAITESDTAIHSVMLSIARTRLNYHKMSIMEPSLANIEKVINISKMYGIEMVATEFYTAASRRVKRSFKVSDMKPMLKRFEDVAKLGCKGFSFHFDDLGQFKEESTNFPGGVGAFQRQFLEEIQKVAKKEDVSFVSMCPTMYMRNWEINAKTWFGPSSNYPDYFKLISQLPEGDIEVFYTDLLGLNDITNRGVNRPAYYLNGVWGSSQMFSVYVGPNRLTWSWYGFEIDPVRGGIVVPETMEAWRNIAKNGIETVWVGSGKHDGAMIAGIWLWNPNVYNEESVVKEMNRTIGLGAGTFSTLMTYEKNVLPLAALFKTYVNRSANEFGVNVIKRKHPLNSDDLVTYWNNYQRAESAVKTIKTILSKESQAYRPYTAQSIVLQMEKTLKTFRSKLINKLKREGITIEK